MSATSERCDVKVLHQDLMPGKGVQVVDVREPAEYAAEHISGTANVPLSGLSRNLDKIERQKPAYLICQSGARSAQAAQTLRQNGYSQVCIIDGGLQAWKEAGLPVTTGASRVWSLERQVRFAAGFLVALGIALAAAVHPYLIGISAFVGVGLMFAAITDTCGMAMILAKMPWNQQGGCSRCAD